MTAFRETVVRELRVADNTFSAAFILAGHPLGIATIRILTMIQFVCDGGDSEWDKIEENLSRKLSATLNPLRTNFTICRRIVRVGLTILWDWRLKG